MTVGAIEALCMLLVMLAGTSTNVFGKISTCDEAKDSNETDGINKFTVYCNNSTSMKLIWKKSYGATHYNVRIIDINSNCLSYNVTTEEFVFDNNKSFVEDNQYWALVTPFPRQSSRLPSLINSKLIGSCPKIGEWTTWSSWGSCQNDGCNQAGKSYRSRNCVRKGTDDNTFDHVACQPSSMHYTQTKQCWKKCEIQNCPPQKDIPFMKRTEVDEVQVHCRSTKKMRLTWNKIEDVSFYTVMISNNVEKCIVLNVTDEEVVFNGDEIGNKDYWGTVTAYSRKKLKTQTRISPTTQTETLFLGGCPKIGIWTSWGAWGECQNSQCGSVGKKFRSKHCVKYGDESTRLQFVHCEPTEATEQDRPCLKKCGNMIRETQPVIAIDTTLLPLSNLKSIPQKDEAIPDNIGIIIGSITGVFVLFAMLLLVFLNRRFAQRKIITRHSSVESWPISLYVSHLNERSKEGHVLSLVQYIASYGIHCNIDLLSQVNINNMGGLANWLPSQIRNSDKILILLSKAYLKALNSPENLECDSEVCKIHTEFHYIKSLMYHSLQRVQLIIVLDGVKCEEIPVEFHGRFYCNFPKRFNKEDDSCCQLIGLLLDEEPLVIEVNELSSFNPTKKI